MKTLVHQNRAYSLYAEVSDMLAPKGYKHIKLTSTFDGSRVPNEERTVWEASLPQEAIQNLKNLL